MFDELVENSPYVKQLTKKAVKEAVKEAKKEAKKEAQEQAHVAEVRTLQTVILSTVQLRFPALGALAQASVMGMTQAKALRHLFDQLILASDEASTRNILETAGPHAS